MTERRHPIHCTCCGKEIIANQQGDDVILEKRIHGKIHTLVLTSAKPSVKVR